MDDDCDFEHSPLSGSLTRDGITVEVEIYRPAGTRDPWRLEVVSLSGGCTRWPERFATEEDALHAFCEALASDGLGSFAVAKPKVCH